MPDIVVRPETLKALQLALTMADRGVHDSHRQTTHIARRILDQISAAVMSRGVEVHQCQRALEACHASERGGCSHEEQRLRDAQRRLQQARDAQRIASQAIAEFDTRSTATLALIDQIDQRGQRFLTKKLGKVAEVNAGTGSSSSTPPSSQATSPGAAATASSGVYSVPGIPAGCVMVPISMIDQTEFPIYGPQDFEKGYTIEDLDYAFELLETTVLPALARGAGTDDFRARDLANKHWGTRSLSMTHSQFFSNKSEAIRLERRPDGTFHIENGRHRIWVASVTGRTHVPAYLLGGRL